MSSYSDVYLRAVSTISSYTLGKLRTGMPAQEYVQYKNDWNFFNSVWAFNYTASTINATAKCPTPIYEFASNAERLSYIRGQISHVDYYPSAAAAGVFNDIR
jgi:hypothetical protein